MEWRKYEASSTDVWPHARMGHTATLVDTKDTWGEDLLVIFGGLGVDKKAVDHVHVFQVQTQAWICPTLSSPGPGPRAFHSAAAVGPCLYIFGGHVYQGDKAVQKFGDLWCLNTATWEWKEITSSVEEPRPNPRDFFTMISLPERLLLFAGLDGADKKLDDVWEFSCKSQSWKEIVCTPKPKSRHGHAMAVIGEQILMCGGETAEGSANDSWVLRGSVCPSEFEPPCWVQLHVPGLPFSPRKAHAIAGIGMQVLVFGGHSTESGWFSRRHEHYHNDLVSLERQGTVSWQHPEVSGPIPSQREFHSLTALSPDLLLLFGGGNGKSIFGDAFLLQRAPKSNTPIQGKHPGLSWTPEEGAKADLLQESPTPSPPSPKQEENLISAEMPAEVAEPQVKHHRGQTRRRQKLKFDQLCQVLGAAAPSSVNSEPTKDELAFRLLGKKQQKDAADDFDDPKLETELARQYLTSQETEALQLSDIPALLWDYQQIPHALDMTDCDSVLAAIEKLSTSSDRRRFLHIQSDMLFLRDVAALHAEYKESVSLYQKKMSSSS